MRDHSPGRTGETLPFLTLPLPCCQRLMSLLVVLPLWQNWDSLRQKHVFSAQALLLNETMRVRVSTPARTACVACVAIRTMPAC